MSEASITPKHEPEVQRAKARRHAAWCNAAVHYAPWVDGDTSPGGGLYVALKLAEQAFRAHQLHYEPGFSNMSSYDPRRFTWVYDPAEPVSDCVKVRDNQTGRLVVWPEF
jgi:hypothetical protein